MINYKIIFSSGSIILAIKLVVDDIYISDGP